MESEVSWVRHGYTSYIGGDELKFYMCNGNKDCDNGLDEELCDEPLKNCSIYGETLALGKFCDGICDCYFCEDESKCRNETREFGIYCNNTLRKRVGWGPRWGARFPKFVPPAAICDGIVDCENKADEANCEGRLECLNSETLRQKHEFKFKNKTNSYNWDYSGSRVTVTEQNSCWVPNPKWLVCLDYTDQLNCSQSQKLYSPLTCSVNGFKTSVSQYAICHDHDSDLCDDGLDQVCLGAQGGCLLHRHFFCDGINNCGDNVTEDTGDENAVICDYLAKNLTCVRRHSAAGAGKPLRIPLDWVLDGIEDCEDGFDENAKNWKKCGDGWITRYIEKSEDCEDVFICSDKEYTPLSRLCDGRKDACQVETDICKMSRKSTEFIQTEMLKSHDKQVFMLGYSVKGLHDLFSKIQGRRELISFQNPLSSDPYLVSNMTLLLPGQPIDCRFVYGELYVLFSCNGGCITTTCILDTRDDISHDTCHNVKEEGWVYTLSQKTGDLTVARKDIGSEHYYSDIFPCNNGKCVPFSQVCDLVDDCGDASDEKECTNHFKCAKSGKFIPLSSVGDGIFHCSDFSDECSESQTLLNPVFEKLAWFIGFVAVFLNLLVMINILTKTRGQRNNEIKVINDVFIFLISVGDLFTGFYLLGLSIVNYRNRDHYCQDQFKWLVSRSCAVLGVISTFGAELSLFTMTALSIYRLQCTRSGIHNKQFHSKQVITLTIAVGFIITSSIIIATFPLVPLFEDFFVNGLYYEGVNLFVGAPSKTDFIEMIERHGLKLGGSSISWQLIRNTINTTMFTSDYQNVSSQILHFYGNDGVCLFKYFVLQTDPQKGFVGTVLLINLLCFLVISVSYVIINTTVILSSARSHSTNQEGDLKMKALQRKIGLIIGTNFICWVPFLMISLFHFLELIDASPWYSFFSIFVLPVNSTINPLLYDTDDFLKKAKNLRKFLMRVKSRSVAALAKLLGRVGGESANVPSVAIRDSGLSKPKYTMNTEPEL